MTDSVISQHEIQVKIVLAWVESQIPSIKKIDKKVKTKNNMLLTKKIKYAP